MKPHSIRDVPWSQLAGSLDGEIRPDEVSRILYATDASVYREVPLAVAFPKHEEDVRRLVSFARAHGVPLIPRAAGTSLAGQVVGAGIVVDVSRHFTRIVAIDPEARTARVQPGVVRNELNLALRPHGLQFAPETSTQNRAMIGGMVGNNACGANSVVYGSTREHLLSARAILSDGSVAEFGDLGVEEFSAKCSGDLLEHSLYRQARAMLSDEENRAEIARQFPKPGIRRRNTGYALDLLAECAPFTPGGPPFNFCRLLAGSEGTLAFLTEITLRLVSLPLGETALVCIHCASIDEALRANLIALRHAPRSGELLDRHILDCTKANIGQRRNRFFIRGDPEAILAVELAAGTREEVAASAARLEADLRAAALGQEFPVVWGADQGRVWEVRKAALGLLANLPGDPKPVAVIEDTAVDPADLPAFIGDFNALLREHSMECVHYGHAASGELHLRPILDLKSPGDRLRFRAIAGDTARLVKRYRGSLSGEHGDGRLRGEFLPMMVGERNYRNFVATKSAWDPGGIFNPGKITGTPPMDTHLRYEPGQATREIETFFDFSETRGYLRAAEKCNGSGDCRKSHLMGGTMCPSYMATRREEDTTRGRANILREVLTRSTAPDPFDSDEIKGVMDLCLSCKGCKSECPSNVDVAKLKAEFLQHYYDARGTPPRVRMIARFADVARLASHVPWAWNLVFGTAWLRRLANRVAGFHPDRTIPLLPATTLKAWFDSRPRNPQTPGQMSRVLFFCDEFISYNEVGIGIAAIELLECLGYEVVIPTHVESGRASLSKGLLRRARVFAEQNVRLLHPVVSEATPLIGLEPSAILTFRDEYPDLLRGDLQNQARELGRNALPMEDFIAREMDAGRVTSGAFRQERKTVHLHGHCQQKALGSLSPTVRILEQLAGHEVRVIPSGCCGMAGSFGYESEHYGLSQMIGELVLFPAVRALPTEAVIAASGTSCRHQIRDGTGRAALHPIQVLRHALICNGVHGAATTASTTPNTGPPGNRTPVS